MMDTILELRNVSLTINGRKIIDNLNANFQRGRVHAIVGPNGAGKSTLAYIIMGLDEYREIDGDIVFEGVSIKNLEVNERAKRGITLAWQEPARYEGLMVRKFLMASARKKEEKAIMEALRMVGLDPGEYIDRRVDKTLSGGERKKIELASIIVMEPKLVLLDEPDSGIDVASLENIFEVVKHLRERGTTIILITHSLTVLKWSEYAFLMCNGKIIDRGASRKIVSFFERRCLSCKHKNIPEA